MPDRKILFWQGGISVKASIVITAFALACMLASSLRAYAQDEPKPHSMTGCLQKGAASGTFKLTNVENGPATVEIAEAKVFLGPHLNHKVEITGTAIAGKDPQTHTMKVTNVKMISETCP